MAISAREGLMTASNGIGTEAQIGLLRCGVFPGRRDPDWLVFSCSWLGQWSWSGEEMDLTSWPSLFHSQVPQVWMCEIEVMAVLDC